MVVVAVNCRADPLMHIVQGEDYMGCPPGFDYDKTFLGPYSKTPQLIWYPIA